MLFVQARDALHEVTVASLPAAGERRHRLLLVHKCLGKGAGGHFGSIEAGPLTLISLSAVA